ncbi:hypothetical protein BUB20358_02722 [Burkholderia ubonensis]|nr:hypothetical protein BUB20358_02722 [Burkholderia ubonensis]
MHLERQSRVLPVQGREHGRQVRHRDVLADAERQASRAGRDRAERVVVRIQQRAGRGQEGLAVGRQLHDPRRALEQRLAEMGFKPLQLQADGRLRGAERVGRAREAREVGNQHERPHRIQVEDFHFK